MWDFDEDGWRRAVQRVTDGEWEDMEIDRELHDRLNEPPPADPFDPCEESDDRTHRFTRLDPAGHRCAFCNRRWRDCLKPHPPGDAA